MSNEARLFAALGALGITWTHQEHAPVATVEESDAVHRAMPGVHSKNLFLKDAGGRFWLVTVPAALRVDLKALPSAIGAKRLSFGKADDMELLLGIAPGAVTPLAAINDAAKAVTIVLDTRIAVAEQTNVHPLRNSATIGLSGKDLVRALTAWAHRPEIVDVPGNIAPAAASQ